ncbi:PREDICTED: neuroendocrine convertase 1-like [Priapulus caudatus]|uniref:Neuroendocrine convertase 1-like n=1 Tax=Priapulus caudatus TaxID=37621 RepID=A0ABM1E7X0_PRICU|nr:PREDICTED: neuroendocrine convertase 1-like [Priapulus caudatus]
MAGIVAQEFGYVNKGKLRGFDDRYVFSHPDAPDRSKRTHIALTRRLIRDNRVTWVEQQMSKIRQKRGGHVTTEKRKPKGGFRDPLWSHQWYLQDTRTTLDLPKLDLHVMPVWEKYTGHGVVVTVLDDGVHNREPPIEVPYYLLLMVSMAVLVSHGTRCAGEIAMVANNNKCGVGVAYNARIGGIRMLDGSVTDRIEAEALVFNLSHVDIYSASWGPSDDGRTVDGPGRLASEAFEIGITKGRAGKGVIYSWASGNGGSFQDDCDCDGYTNSIYTISVSSASEHGKSPWYAERCASTMASTYSSGAYTDQKIVSTDLHNKCTTEHTGTSASAPLAAGIFALALEANPNLTWRDMQHLVVWTSEYAPLSDNPGWQTNNIGLKVNTRFGFGLMNAAALVEMANPQTWKTVPEKKICTVSAAKESLPKFIYPESQIEVVIGADGCQGTDMEINYIEHIQLYITLDYTYRGALSIYLISPYGMSTCLLASRAEDHSKDGFKNWAFMSVHNWGENPKGNWRLSINGSGDNKGFLGDYTLVIHGTKEQPNHMKKGKRVYNENYNQVKDGRSYAVDYVLITDGDGDTDPQRSLDNLDEEWPYVLRELAEKEGLEREMSGATVPRTLDTSCGRLSREGASGAATRLEISSTDTLSN